MADRARARPGCGRPSSVGARSCGGARGGDRRCPFVGPRRPTRSTSTTCWFRPRGARHGPAERPARCRPSTRRRRTCCAPSGKHRRVADKSPEDGRQSSLGAVTALWWMYRAFKAAVTLTAPSSHQVESILWKEIRLIAQGNIQPSGPRGSGPKLPGINGEPGGRLYMNASGGLWLGDGWGIAGSRRTSRSGCRAGAAHSSSTSSMRRPVTRRTSQAVLGNLGGGGASGFGQPDAASGTFYDAFHGKAEAW